MRIEIYTTGAELPRLIDGPVLHSAMLFRSYGQSSKCRPYMLVAYDSDGAEIGHLLMVRKHTVRIIPPVFSVWYSIQGEGAYRPGCNREEVFACFLDKVFGMFGFHHTFIEVRNIEDSRFAYGTLRKHSFIPVRDHRNYISLHSRDPKERLTRAYRAHIRKSIERGVTFRRATGREEIEEGLRLMKAFYRSKTRKSPPQTAVLAGMLLGSDGRLQEQAKMFLVMFKGKIIGASVCLYEETRALLAYTFGLRKRFPLQFPGIMAIWAAIADAYSSGYDHFEFLEVRGLSRLRKSFLSTIGNFGGKDVSTLQWYHFKWNWVNKFLRWIYV